MELSVRKTEVSALYGFGYYYYDPTYLLLIPGLILALVAQGLLSSPLAKLSRGQRPTGVTGAELARRGHEPYTRKAAYGPHPSDPCPVCLSGISALWGTEILRRA